MIRNILRCYLAFLSRRKSSVYACANLCQHIPSAVFPASFSQSTTLNQFQHRVADAAHRSLRESYKYPDAYPSQFDHLILGTSAASGITMASSDTKSDRHLSLPSFRRRNSKEDTLHQEYVMEPESLEIFYPNAWSRYREIIREPFAEFLGVAVLIIFGTGVDCQVVLGGNTAVTSSEKGAYFSINVGWAVGTAMGVWVSGGISGGHINPAVTIAMAVFRGFPWKKVPIYIISQLLGGVVGAAVVYANYFHAIDLAEGLGVRTLSTAGLFSTYALPYMTNVSCFFSEFLGTMVLVFVVLAINDKKNSPPPPGLAPLVLFLLVLGLGTSLGMETGYAINPARDLGPRLLTAMVGYGKEVFTFRNQYWLWCPVLGPILGALCAALIYDAAIYTGEDSILNKPNKEARRRQALMEERSNIPGVIKPDVSV